MLLHARSNTHLERSLLWRLHIDAPLLVGLLALMLFGLVVLYSAGGGEERLLVRQSIRLGVALVVMFVVAQVPPRIYRQASLPLFGVGIALLIAVLVFGAVGKGAQRWLDLGFFRFQPSEIMKLAVPMALAWYFSEKRLPPTFRQVFVALVVVAVPTLLIAKQPDLGTSLFIASSGIFVIYLAGLSWKFITFAATVAVIFVGLIYFAPPEFWDFFLKDYQKERILTFLNPERDPLGAGFHIRQSQIAIGSGGVYGKGWLDGTQSQLEFLPERTTDFIFAVLGEEFGLSGVVILLTLYLLVIGRGLYISTQGQDTYSRLLAGALTLTFFVYLFVNIGMVTGLLPVVGLPLPLVSYGGTSMVTLMAAFGILMSIQTHRRLHSK